MNGNNKKSKYFEIIIGAIVTLGIAVIGYTFKDFADKIDSIESTIAKHHGPEWQKVEKVIAITNLKNETENTIVSLQKRIEKLEKIKEALCCWTEQGDRIMTEVQNRKYDCYAHINIKSKSNEKSAFLNTANIYGRNFQVGDEIEVQNLSSGSSETVIAKIVSTYSNLDFSDVLIQLNEKAAEVINFSVERGKIKVRVSPKKQSPNKSWKTLEMLRDNIEES